MGETENRTSLKERRQKYQNQSLVGFLNENKSMLLLFSIIVAALAVILISILTLHVSAVAVCVIVVIEAALAVCLHDVPIWLHGLVVLAQVIAGVLVECVVFILLCSVIYLIGILTLKFMRE